MFVDIVIYRSRIGMHYSTARKHKGIKYFSDFEVLLFITMFLYKLGDIERNPGQVAYQTKAHLTISILIHRRPCFVNIFQLSITTYKTYYPS